MGLVTRVAVAGLVALCVALMAASGGALATRGRAAAVYNLVGYPHASFTWFPAFPQVGQTILLVSTSTDRTSPIVAYAWDVSDDGPFGVLRQGGPSATASFFTPATHAVRLRVTARDGLSTTVTEPIQMGPAPADVMSPFPNVRIFGRLLRSGVKLSLLSIRAPAQAWIAVSCDGRGCPARSAGRAAASRAGRPTWTNFGPFERFLTPGVTLEVRVSKQGEIGAFTRFTVRRHRLPLRTDSCLAPVTLVAMACPGA